MLIKIGDISLRPNCDHCLQKKFTILKMLLSLSERMRQLSAASERVTETRY